MKMFKEFWEEEDGIATVEILLILAVLIIIAVIFRKAIIDWVKKTVESLFGSADSGADTSEVDEILNGGSTGE